MTDGAQKPPANEIFIAPCSTSITGGKAKLEIGALASKSGIFLGEYALKVFPYIFMNETGSLSMPLPEESFKKLTEMNPVVVTGQATTAKNGKVRKVNAKLTPTAKDAGAVTFSFTGENTKLVFNSNYKIRGK